MQDKGEFAGVIKNPAKHITQGIKNTQATMVTKGQFKQSRTLKTILLQKDATVRVK